MTVKVISVPANEVGQLEINLNQLLQTPQFDGFGVAASFLTSDFNTIVLILQKA